MDGEQRESAEAHELHAKLLHSVYNTPTSPCLSFPRSKMGRTVPPLGLWRGSEIRHVKHLAGSAPPPPPRPAPGGEPDRPCADFARRIWGRLH